MVAEVKQNRDFASSALIHNWLNRLGPLLGLVLVIVIFAVDGTPGGFYRLTTCEWFLRKR